MIKDTYKYHIKVGDKIILAGTTKDINRERESRRNWDILPKGWKLHQVDGGAVTQFEAGKWLQAERMKGINVSG